MLITRAEIDGRLGDVRIEAGRILAVGDLQPFAGEHTIHAQGNALVPGLHDHHLHFLSFAAALDSIRCGPLQVQDADALAAALGSPSVPDAAEWLRGIGYHESVAGEIDRHWLDRHAPDRPVRIQHRSGRLWIVNSAGIDRLRASASADPRPNPDLTAAFASGRFYDQDAQLRDLWGSSLPGIERASQQLAAYGVTGFTDMTPHNNAQTFATLASLQAEGALRQFVLLAGVPELAGETDLARLRIGATKVHLHEAQLPDFDTLCGLIAASHQQSRPVAVHCVTELELVYTLAAFRRAGAEAGDRVEHASVTPPALLEQIRELALTVVTQPNFIAERGDAYRADLPAAEHDWLYRCRAFLQAGIDLGGGTDAPFGHADPWRAMQAAMHRQTASGHLLGIRERLSPEQALALFLGAPDAPAQVRTVRPGAAADLCLLDRPWREARTQLCQSRVMATLCGGRLIYDRVDQPPGQRGLS